MSYARREGGLRPRQGQRDDQLAIPSSSKNVDPRTGRDLDMSRDRSGRRHRSSKSLRESEVLSDSSLDRRSSSKATTPHDSTKKTRRVPLNDDRYRKDPSRFRDEKSRRLGDESLDLRSSHKSNDSKGRDGRKSPEFGGPYRHDRLDTFGGEGRRDERQGSRTRPEYDRDRRPGNLSRHDSRDLRDERRSDPRRGKLGARPPTGPRGRDTDMRKYDSRTIQGRDRGVGSEKGSRASRGATSSYDDPRYEKHISSKLSKRKTRPMNFNQAKTKREKDWMLDFQSHRPVLYLPERMEQPEKETISYLIKLAGVNNIPTESIPKLKEKGVTPTLTYSCTLYDQKEREFIGRSYSSRPIQLKPLFKDTDPNSKEFLFMHTSTKDENLCLVIEAYLEIVELENKNKTHYVSLGYSIFLLFSPKGQAVETSLPMYLGSPRFLV